MNKEAIEKLAFILKEMHSNYVCGKNPLDKDKAFFLGIGKITHLIDEIEMSEMEKIE